jgi:protein-S-isoprenylcysteine O-methyltransferase Ste14
MKASAIEFRLRMAIMAIIITLGFWAPWIEGLGIGKRISLLEWLALESSRLGLLQYAAAAPAVIVASALVAAAGAILRVWGTAYLGAFTVNSMQMKAGAVMAEGPYRHLRNPLYLGSWCMFAAMAFVMPASGALFAMLLLTVFLLRLILGEEAFLVSHLGEPYWTYLHAVPRIFPRLRSSLPPGLSKPRWLNSVLSELNPIGIFVVLAVLSWSYDNELMVKGALISFGISLVVRALLPGITQETSLPE